ncbi:MAG TPA: hypothetical protein VEX36_08470 [Thermoleophilaceae bacterium]|nr:hypothetical protein [Thermoleophilaceae bacterium]
MDLDTAVLAVGGAWIAAMTVVVLGLIRQIGLITVRMERDQHASAAVNDGLNVGEAVPEAVIEQLAVDEHSVGYLLILGAVCTPCRELASDLGGAVLERPVTALISGSEELSGAMSSLLPDDVSVIRDAGEGEIAQSLRVETSPFVFEIADGKVRGKAVLRGAEHLLSFMQAPPERSNGNGNGSGATLHIQEVERHAGS